jgi:hypothetical protein
MKNERNGIGAWLSRPEPRRRFVTFHVPGKARRAALVPLLAILVLCAGRVAAEGWGIIGRAISSTTGEPLAYANVALFRLASATDTLGAAVGGAISRPDGTFRIVAPAGRYRIVASYISYQTKVIGGIEVKDGAPVTLDIVLAPSTVKLETIQVKSTVLRDNEAAVLAKQKTSVAVSDGISQQQIARTPDNNAAEVVQRVTGLSLVSGKYVFVRGLGERYSATEVNGATIGTPEPNKRIVPLDLFASGLLDNIVVQKTYTPDQPGEFGGGVVNVQTRDFPGHRIWDFTIGSGYNANTTGRTFLGYDGGGTDYLGIDDGTRSMPDVVRKLAGRQKLTTRSAITHEGFSADTLALLGRSFSRVWTPASRRGRPAANFSGSYGDELSVLGRSLGFLTSVSYANSYQSSRSEENFYKSDGGVLEAETAYQARTSHAGTLWGAIGNAGYRLSDAGTFTLRTMYNRSTDDEVRYYEGDNHDTGKPLRNTRLDYVERGLFSGSAVSTWTFPSLHGLSTDLRYTYSHALRNEPDRREYTYERETDVIYDREDPVDTLDVWVLSKRSASLGLTRMFGRMVEEERGPEIHASLPFHQWSGLESKVKIGALYKNKDRNSSWRRFAFREPSFRSNAIRDSVMALDPERLMTDSLITGDSKGFIINELTKQDTDNYMAHQDVTAFYAMCDLPLGTKVRAVFGARVEKARIRVDSYDIFGQWPDSLLSHSRLDNTDLLPSVNLTVSPGAKTNLRLAYSSTLSRPDLRELSDFALTDFVSGYPEVGNPDLKRARIHNFDLRLENYPGGDELAAVSLFYKRLVDQRQGRVSRRHGVRVPLELEPDQLPSRQTGQLGQCDPGQVADPAGQVRDPDLGPAAARGAIPLRDQRRRALCDGSGPDRRRGALQRVRPPPGERRGLGAARHLRTTAQQPRLHADPRGGPGPGIGPPEALLREPPERRDPIRAEAEGDPGGGPGGIEGHPSEPHRAERLALLVDRRVNRGREPRAHQERTVA